jgi:hypothetical protein
MNLCNDGKASAYLEGAAEFDGRGAELALLARYDGFSKQKLAALKSCIERLRLIYCTDKLLEGDLTYAMLIKMYTNQCFCKYPHFQLSELSENKRFSNNSNKFRPSNGKGKQGKGKGKNKRMIPYRKWRDGKGKRGNQNHQRARSNDHGQTYTQNSYQAKGKGNGKGFKGKGKGKGKPRFGDRKKDFNEKNYQDNETKPVTNNMQKVYRDEPHCLGDDETTIVLTQNVTRIVVNKEEANNEEDDEA